MSCTPNFRDLHMHHPVVLPADQNGLVTVSISLLKHVVGQYIKGEPLKVASRGIFDHRQSAMTFLVGK